MKYYIRHIKSGKYLKKEVNGYIMFGTKSSDPAICNGKAVHKLLLFLTKDCKIPVTFEAIK